MKLQAPSDVTSASVDATEYQVEADGTVVVDPFHGPALVQMGFALLPHTPEQDDADAAAEAAAIAEAAAAAEAAATADAAAAAAKAAEALAAKAKR